MWKVELDGGYTPAIKFKHQSDQTGVRFINRRGLRLARCRGLREVYHASEGGRAWPAVAWRLARGAWRVAAAGRTGLTTRTVVCGVWNCARDREARGPPCGV